MSAGAWIPCERMFEKVLAVVREARETKWFWFKHPNVHVKYINIRIDMRDGNCIVTDNKGNLIDISTLSFQEETKRS